MNCAYCLQEGKGLINAVTMVNGTHCCREHAKLALDKQDANTSVKKAPPRAGDRLQK